MLRCLFLALWDATHCFVSKQNEIYAAICDYWTGGVVEANDWRICRCWQVWRRDFVKLEGFVFGFGKRISQRFRKKLRNSLLKSKLSLISCPKQQQNHQSRKSRKFDKTRKNLRKYLRNSREKFQSLRYFWISSCSARSFRSSSYLHHNLLTFFKIFLHLLPEPSLFFPRFLLFHKKVSSLKTFIPQISNS